MFTACSPVNTECSENYYNGVTKTGQLNASIIKDITNDEAVNKDNDTKVMDAVDNICRAIQNIDFSVKEFSINFELFDLETDIIYKTSFYNVIHNKKPLIAKGKEGDDEAALFIDLYRGKWQDNNEFVKYLKTSPTYYYFDFDGDGFPELVIADGNGLEILKYNSENGQVYHYLTLPDYWHVMGSNQVYCYIPTSANRLYYSYQNYNENKTVSDRVVFEICFLETEIGWSKKYFVSIGESETIEVAEDLWFEITTDFFTAIDNALSPLSFEEMFGKIFQ